MNAGKQRGNLLRWQLLFRLCRGGTWAATSLDLKTWLLSLFRCAGRTWEGLSQSFAQSSAHHRGRRETPASNRILLEQLDGRPASPVASPCHGGVIECTPKEPSKPQLGKSCGGHKPDRLLALLRPRGCGEGQSPTPTGGCGLTPEHGDSDFLTERDNSVPVPHAICFLC